MPAHARFHVPDPPPPGQELRLVGEEFHHLRHVLRVKVGDAVSVFDGAGRGFHAVLVALEPRAAILRMESEETPSTESPLGLHLAPALAKGEKLDWVIQKGTELGVTVFHPLIAQRADLKL